MMTTQDAQKIRTLAKTFLAQHRPIGAEWSRACAMQGIRFSASERALVRRAVVENFFAFVDKGEISPYLQMIRQACVALGETPEVFQKIGHALCAFQDILLARVAKTRKTSQHWALAGALHRLAIEAVFQSLGDSFRDPVADDRVSERRWNLLTRREHEVASLLSQGLRNKGIAQKLGISVRTVEHHRARIREKLGIDSVAGLSAAAALHPGVLRTPS